VYVCACVYTKQTFFYPFFHHISLQLRASNVSNARRDQSVVISSKPSISIRENGCQQLMLTRRLADTIHTTAPCTYTHKLVCFAEICCMWALSLHENIAIKFPSRSERRYVETCRMRGKFLDDRSNFRPKSEDLPPRRLQSKRSDAWIKFTRCSFFQVITTQVLLWHC